MNSFNYDLDRLFALRSVSIGPKCPGTFYHTFSVSFAHRETATGTATNQIVVLAEELRMCETKVGLRNELHSFFLQTESISSDPIFFV